MRFFTFRFFVKLLLLVPKGMPRNDSDFFSFHRLGALTASPTLVKQALPVTLAPVRNSSPVSWTSVSDAFAVVECCTDVNDTIKANFTSVNDTSGANLTGVNSFGKTNLTSVNDKS